MNVKIFNGRPREVEFELNTWLDTLPEGKTGVLVLGMSVTGDDSGMAVLVQYRYVVAGELR